MEAVLRAGLFDVNMGELFRQAVKAIMLAVLLAFLVLGVKNQKNFLEKEVNTYFERKDSSGMVDVAYQTAIPELRKEVEENTVIKGMVEKQESLKEAAIETTIPSKKDSEIMVPVSVPSMENESNEETKLQMITVTFHGNGGSPDVMSVSGTAESFDLAGCGIPRKLGKEFNGWYLDSSCTTPYLGISDGITEIELYAGWKEFDGFLSDDFGNIIGYTDLSIASDGIVVFPASEDCVGVKRHALDGLEDHVLELYIPANVTNIERELFENLSSLMYIEVMPDNPVYYSENGILYTKSGETVCVPNGR